MYVEVVKVDPKGRVTIPSYMRIVLGIESGSRVVLALDEERKVIEIRLVEPGPLFHCTNDSVKIDEIEYILKEYGKNIVHVTCISRDNEHHTCRVLVRKTPIEVEGFICKEVE